MTINDKFAQNERGGAICVFLCHEVPYAEHSPGGHSLGEEVEFMSAEREKIGKQEFWFDQSSGFIYLIHTGTLDADEARVLNERVAACVNTHTPGEPPFMLVDNRRATGFTGEARKIMSSAPTLRDEIYVGLFGASFAIRAVLNLLFRAVALSNSSKSAVAAYATEAEAREWLTEQKRAFRARKPKNVA